MKKTYILLSIFLIFISCNEKNKNNNSNGNNPNDTKQSSFTANIDNNQFIGKNMFYEKNQNNALLIAIAEDYSKIMLNIISTEPGKYILDSTSIYINDKGSYYIEEGLLVIDKNQEGYLSGTFKFTAQNINGNSINVEEGKFNNIIQEQSIVSGNTINTNQYTIVFVDKGSVKTENEAFQITINDQNVVFTNKKQVNNSYSVKIKEKQQLPNALILKSFGDKYDYIYIDNLQKTVTVFYLDGNSITYK